MSRRLAADIGLSLCARSCEKVDDDDENEACLAV